MKNSDSVNSEWTLKFCIYSKLSSNVDAENVKPLWAIAPYGVPSEVRTLERDGLVTAVNPIPEVPDEPLSPDDPIPEVPDEPF